jgi:BirA family biotin operon repressor/biotin-[acetyl-CoA-carboxylase] ligase
VTLRELTLRGRPHLRVLPSTTSTNDDARAWAEQDAPDGAIVVADSQSTGRGRAGRSWVSPPGVNLYLSCVVRAPVNRLRLLPLLGAIAAREAVERHASGAVVVIKWPNDILADGKKVAGILAELLQEPSPAGILGIGINVNMEPGDFPADLRHQAASLRMVAGQAVVRRMVLETLLGSLDAWRARLHEDPMALVQAFTPYCATIGRRVRVVPPGREPFIATARSVDPDGLLIVENEGGKTIRVEAGDVDPVD